MSPATQVYLCDKVADHGKGKSCRKVVEGGGVQVQIEAIALPLDPAEASQTICRQSEAVRNLLTNVTWDSTDGVQSLLDEIAGHADEIDGIAPALDEDEMPRTRKLGAPILSYNLVFDNDDQQQRWFLFLRQIREKYQGETIAARLDAFLTEQWSD